VAGLLSWLRSISWINPWVSILALELLLLAASATSSIDLPLVILRAHVFFSPSDMPGKLFRKEKMGKKNEEKSISEKKR